jgi:hypothetical protein
MGGRRPKISKDIETEVLLKSRRRCALCFGLRGIRLQKPGQIAHLDQDRTNNTFDNLCWLCQPHHNWYDTTTSQAKGLTISEVKTYRDTLYAAIPDILAGSPRKAGSVSVSESVIEVTAGAGKEEPGGDVRIEGGTGRRGASGGDVNIGAGTYRAGDGGPGGKGGDLTIKAGDAE